jgi:hypothetical protein
MAATASANGGVDAVSSDQPFAGLSQLELEKIALLLEENDQLDE